MTDQTFSTYIVLSVVTFTAVGLTIQCFSSYREKRAEYLSFPIALFILLPYPLWAVAGVMRDDPILLLIMAILGVPNLALSAQYFAYEWPRLTTPKLAAEDQLAITLALVGAGLAFYFLVTGTPLKAAEVGGAYFTSCLMMYSYLAKIWRVYLGQQNINGLKWAVLLTLSVQYGVMILYAVQSDNLLLQVGYMMAEASCLAAIGYKLLRNDVEPAQA